MKDLRLIVWGAFRYYLGRKNYMPKTITDFIIDNRGIFFKQDWKDFIKEIDECSDLGMDYDKETWNNFKEFCRSML